MSIATGNWTTITTWQRYNGTAFVASPDYPGASTGTGEVTISAGDAVTLNVTPANPIGTLAIEGGAGNTSLTISNTFILNVTGAILIDAATGAAATKSIVLNGASAQLNAASLAIVPSNNANKTAFLQFNGGMVNITGCNYGRDCTFERKNSDYISRRRHIDYWWHLNRRNNNSTLLVQSQ